MMFPAAATGKCSLCGNDGLFFKGGGTLYCERCVRGLLDSTQQYMIEDGFIFFLMRDGTVSDGDHKYSSLAELEHNVILAYRATRQ